MIGLGRLAGEIAYLYKWPPRTILWGMNLEQALFWRKQGWMAHLRAQGIEPEQQQEEAPDNDKPDRAALRRRFGSTNYSK